MVRKVDIAVAFIFGILIAVPLSMQFAGAWTGTQNTLSDGYMEIANINATHYYLNDANYTLWIETLTALGLLQDGSEGLTGNWNAGNYLISAQDINATSDFWRAGANYTDWIDTLVALQLLQDGSEGLTGNWDVGAYNITADNFTAADFYLESIGNITAYIDSGDIAGGSSGLSIGAYDYNIFLNATDSLYYAYNKTGSTMNTDADAIDCLQDVLDLDTDPKTIYLSSDFDAGTDTAVLTYSGITLKTDGQTWMSGNTWSTPRIGCVNITASSQHVANIRLEGLNLRGVYMDTMTGAASQYNIAQVWLERVSMRPDHDFTYGQGIRILGDNYTMFVHLTDVKINDWMDTTASDSKGAFSVESAHDGNGQYYFTRVDYKVREDNTVLFGASGRTILFRVDSLSYVNLQNGAGSKVVQLWPGARFTDMKITNSLFEIHYAQDIFQIDDGAADQIILNCLFQGNTISLSNDEDVTFIDDNSDEADWVTWTFSGIFGSWNNVKLNGDHWIPGDTGHARFNYTVVDWMYGPG